jgi:RNA polymerase sigma-70 factor (ECF subfamily)
MEEEQVDQILVREAKRGSQQAFEQLVEKYKKKAYFLARKLLTNSEDAEDVAQEAFIKAYKNIGSFREEASFWTWFCRIIVNLAHTHLRQRYLLNKFRIFSKRTEEEEGKGEKPIIDLRKGPLEKTLDRELKEKIDQAIDSLPGKQKEVFVLKHLENFKIEEISQVLNISPGTVKIHLFRALQNLQKKLKEYEK